MDHTAKWRASQLVIAARREGDTDIELRCMKKCVHYVTDSCGTGKTHIALALGMAACQRGHRVCLTTTAALVSELIEARDEKKMPRFQKQIASYELLILDELGFVPLSKTGAELLFEMLSQRYERGSTMVTSNLPFQEWTEVLGSHITYISWR